MKTTRRKMSLVQLTFVTAANMLGAGIIMLPTKLAEVGTISIISWLITALGSLALAMTFARCGMFTTKPGGMGGYSEYAFGRIGHFMANYAYAVSIVIANVAIAISAVGYGAGFLGTSFTPLQTCLYTIALLWIAAALNFSGSRYSGKLSTITIWGAIIPVLGISLIGWYWFEPSTWISSWNPNDVGFIDAVGNSIALTLWSFLGLESAAVNMDAVENPQRSVPIATFVSTLGVAFIYVASTNVIAGIVPNAEILSSSAPFGLAFSYMLGSTAGKVVMGLMVFSCAGSLLSWQFTLARVFKTSAGLVPEGICQGHQRRRSGQRHDPHPGYAKLPGPDDHQPDAGQTVRALGKSGRRDECYSLHLLLLRIEIYLGKRTDFQRRLQQKYVYFPVRRIYYLLHLRLDDDRCRNLLQRLSGSLHRLDDLHGSFQSLETAPAAAK